MNTQKNMVYVALAIVIALLLIGAATMLGIGLWRLGASQKESEKLIQNWKSFYQANPFPSRENILQEKKNTKIIEDWFAKLMEMLRKGQIDPVQKSPSMFQSLLDERRNRMVEIANDNGLDKDKSLNKFDFGFSRYLGSGNLPAPENVPILTQQLMIIEDLFGIFMDAKITEMIRIERDEFESGAVVEDKAVSSNRRRRPSAAASGPVPPGVKAAAVSSPRPGAISGDALYGKLHFAFEFMAYESSIWDILNKIANHGMIVVVTSVRLENQGIDLSKLGGPDESSKDSVVEEGRTDDARGSSAQMDRAAVSEPEGAQEQAQSKYPSRAERQVSGLNKAVPMKARIEMDVYRFKGE